MEYYSTPKSVLHTANSKLPTVSLPAMNYEPSTMNYNKLTAFQTLLPILRRMPFLCSACLLLLRLWF